MYELRTTHKNNIKSTQRVSFKLMGKHDVKVTGGREWSVTLTQTIEAGQRTTYIHKLNTDH